jgi:diguanylate cyclase (GGDEF)-like protein/PAS domain S-box-containing protein
MNMDKIRILIVEDEGLIARDIEDMVRNAGYEIGAVVGTGEEAVEKAETTHPDLILMDIILRGEMDGVEAAEKIREGFNIPVIYLTAHTDENTLQRAKLTEPLGYTLKPVDQKELMTVIEMALYKHQMEEKLRERQGWLSTILQSIGEGVIATDRFGNITFMNPVAEKLTGWNQPESIGKPLTSVLHLVDEDTGKLVRVAIPELLANNSSNPLNGNIQIVNYVEKIPIELASSVIQDEVENICGLVLVLHDLTERKRYEEKLRYNAVTDHLTELPNRFLFFDRLNMALAQAQRDFQKLGILMLDLDEFKKVNDTHGHNVGDQLLRGVASRLLNMFRKGDTIARWGGDEFILLLPEIRQAEAAKNVAERILHSFHKPFEFNGLKISITASIGVAIYAEDGSDADTLIKNADIAMYHAKDSGRNCYHQYTHEQREYTRH